VERCGIETQNFDESFDDIIGTVPLDIAAIRENAIVVATDSATIKVPAEKSRFIKTRLIDGVSYILIPVDGAVLVNGIPAAGNKWIINDILRKEWGFDKTVITDYHSFVEMKNHGYCGDIEQCTKVACETETDIEMMSTCFLKHGANYMTEEELDKKVLRILELKEKMGLLEDPYLMASEEAEKEMFLCDEHRELCRIAAEKSAVLLKNDGVLPLSENVEKVAVIGPFAKDGMIGFWSCHGKADEATSVYDGIAATVGADKVSYAQGADKAVRAKPDFAMIDEAVEAAKAADCAVICLGESALMSGEGNSRVDVALSDAQKTLVRAVSAVNKNTVVVLFNGRPLALGDIIDDAPAFMTIWQPGTEGGSAVANLLFGKVNFEGRLTMSFPYHVGQCPIYYNRMMTGRPKPWDDKHYAYCSNYIDYPNAPLFPFGYGLSYTSFEISEPVLSASTMASGETLTATVNVKNTGSVAGVANVQMYIRDLAASLARPIREMKDYKRVELLPGEEKTISFEINEPMLAFHTADGSFDSEAGEFHVFVSENAEAGKPVSFRLIK
jgi:beta-glucosidase